MYAGNDKGSRNKSNKLFQTKKFKIMKKLKVTEIFDFYIPAKNEEIVCIENFDDYSYKVYAVYVNGLYDRRIKVKKH